MKFFPAKKVEGPKVEASFEQAEIYISEKMLACKDQPQKSCYELAAKDFLSKFSLPQVLEVFAANEKKPEFFTKCHLVAHYLGQEAYRLSGSVRKVFEQSSRSCLGGSYHGAVEGYFIAKGLNIDIDTNPNLGKEVAGMCGKREEYAAPQQFTECNHGLGHALMFITNNDLIKALNLCDNLESLNERELCYTGSLMANSDGGKDTDHPSKYLDPKDPLYPCPILEKKYQNQCYTYGVLSQFQSDLDKAIELCTKIPDEFQSACFRTIGRDRTMVSADVNELTAQCQKAPDEFKTECMKGTAYNLVIRFGPGSELPFEYCGIQTQSKAECYEQIVIATSGQSQDKTFVSAVCGKIPVEFKNERCN